MPAKTAKKTTSTRSKTTKKAAPKKAAAKKTPAKKAAPKKAAAKPAKPTEADPVAQEPTVTPEPEVSPVADPLADYEASLEADSDLPTPDALSTSPEVVDEVGGLGVEDVPVETAVIGVDESPIISDEPVVSQVPMVRVRAIITKSTPPLIGHFNFLTITGREARTGAPIRGEFKDGYIYSVPANVADTIVDYGWALKV